MTQVPAKPIDPMKEFQDQLKDRVRKDIADLLPPEALEALVKRAIDEEFFKREKYNASPNSYHPEWKEGPSAFCKAVVEAAAPLIKVAVEKTVKDREQMIVDAILEYLDKNKLTIMVGSQITGVMCSMMEAFKEVLRRNGLNVY